MARPLAGLAGAGADPRRPLRAAARPISPMSSRAGRAPFCWRPSRLGRAPPRELAGPARAAIVDEAERAAEEPLFHLYNLLAERGLHLLLLARAAPARWGIALPDLRSRLRAAPVAYLAPPNDALLAALLVKLFADRQLRVGEEVVACLISRLERSFAAAQCVVAALDQAALAGQRPITVPLAREVLGEG